jgi:hypothetical protein
MNTFYRKRLLRVRERNLLPETAVVKRQLPIEGSLDFEGH